MGFLTDLARALYDLPGIGRELSTRRAGRVFLTLLLAAGVYGVATGLWYAAAVGELAGLTVSEAKTHLPSWTISGGQLASPAAQPVIVTERDLSPRFFAQADDWLRRWFHAGSPGSAKAAWDQLLERYPRLFCFVLDTTGRYADRIQPDAYQVSLVMSREAAVMASQRSNGVRERRELPYRQLTARSPFVQMDPRQMDPVAVARAARGALSGWFAAFGMLASVVRFAWKALLVALVGWGLGAMIKRRVTFGRAYAIAVYALVPVALLGVLRLLVAPFAGGLLLLLHVIYGTLPVWWCPSNEAAAVP